MTLAIKMIENPTKYCEGWNFGPSLDSIVPVWDIASMVIKNYGKGELKDISNRKALHEAKLLALDITKARFELGWTPRWNIEQTIQKTVEWYTKYQTTDVYQLCINQIEQYTNDNQR